jgi:hypothetical protein
MSGISPEMSSMDRPGDQQPGWCDDLNEDVRLLVEMAQDISRESEKLAHESKMRRHEAAELRRQMALVRAEVAALRRGITETWQLLRSVCAGRR